MALPVPIWTPNPNFRKLVVDLVFWIWGPGLGVIQYWGDRIHHYQSSNNPITRIYNIYIYPFIGSSNDYQPNYHPPSIAYETIINHDQPVRILFHGSLLPSNLPAICIEALEFLIQFVVQIAEAAFDQTVGDPDLLLASAKCSSFRSLICKNTWLNHVW